MSPVKKTKTSKVKTVPSKKATPLTEPVVAKKKTKSNYFSTGYPASLFPGNWKINAGIFLLLLLTTLGLYSSDLQLGFFSIDDAGYVTDNPWIKKISFENLSHIFTSPYFSNFSPVHLLSYMFDYAIAGADPFAFHLSSNIWAGVAAGFVFLVALALTGRYIIAIPAAILFVVHPAHVEAVAWISNRKDLIATVFALPSLLAYIKYRQGGPSSSRWYILSVFLFLLAVAGKVSVAVFPAIFFLMDLFIERRPFNKSIVDKIPYVLVTAIIALVVYFAQPISGHAPDPSVFANAFAQSAWLLTGFGEYVIYRLRPEGGNIGTGIISTLFLLALLIVPFVFRKRFPLVAVLIYWIILGWLPAQLLSFVHPVSDRYLFFPSVAFVILLAWAIVTTLERLGRSGTIAAMAILTLIGFFWARSTLNYLAEWNDPKSVWYSSLEKSEDPDVPYNLGTYYLDVAGRLGNSPRGNRLDSIKVKRIANELWKDNPKLATLLSEWDAGKHGGPAEMEFQKYLWSLASERFEKALQTIGTHVFPHLFFRRGVLMLDRGDLQGAKKEFQAAIGETSLSTVEDIKKEIAVSSYNALGAIYWREGNYREALKWYKKTQEEQTRFGGNWISDLDTKIKNLELTVAMMSQESGSAVGNADPEVAYTVGLRFLESAGQLGSAPRQKFSQEQMEQLAKEVWAGNDQLPLLLSEWEKGQHGGPAEIAFKNHLRKLSWNAFETALRAKGSKPMPHLFFRRGMWLGEGGNFQAAKKEFLAAVEEAPKETNVGVRNEMLVISHDALGVLAWTSKDYKEALSWFKIAEEEQKRLGGNWVPDISSKRQQMEALAR